MDIFYSRSMDALRLQSVVLLGTSNIAFAWKRLRNFLVVPYFFIQLLPQERRLGKCLFTSFYGLALQLYMNSFTGTC
jgi:hypothetical protein